MDFEEEPGFPRVVGAYADIGAVELGLTFTDVAATAFPAGAPPGFYNGSAAWARSATRSPVPRRGRRRRRHGRGVFQSAGTLVVNNCQFTGNSAIGGNGGSAGGNDGAYSGPGSNGGQPNSGDGGGNVGF